MTFVDFCESNNTNIIELILNKQLYLHNIIFKTDYSMYDIIIVLGYKNILYFKKVLTHYSLYENNVRLNILYPKNIFENLFNIKYFLVETKSKFDLTEMEKINKSFLRKRKINFLII